MAMNGRPGIDIGRQVVAKGTGGRSISRRFATAEAVVEFFFLLCVAACVWPGLGEDAIVGRAVVFWRGLRFGAIDRLPPSCSRLDHLLLPTIDEIGRERTRGGRTKRRFSSFLCVCVCVELSSCTAFSRCRPGKMAAAGLMSPSLFFFRATRRRSIFFSSAFGSQLFPVFKVSQPVKWRRRR